MEIYYFSFGQVHVHRIDGITLDADKLMKLIQDKIRAKKCVRVFKPANRLPRS